uniref:PH domain-containing protein n=1 Tax=Mola mola TaxID=94237 RepID=A0A3Q4BL64_MOLML
MSRRRVSVRDLGSVDCEGWLLHRKEGRSFLGSKWKRFWFVLKRSSLYWYSDQVVSRSRASLWDFLLPVVENLQLCILMFLTPFCFWLIAADVLLLAPVGGESRGVHPPVRLHHRTGQTVREETVRRVCCHLCSRKRDRKITPTSLVVKQSNISHSRTSTPIFSSLAVIKTPPDEMESLYNCLKAVRLSPIGRPSQRDFRASFIRRCHNDQVNNKLHLLRILSSTLKAKESALQALEQILHHPALTPRMYRKWRLSNSILLQEIRQRKMDKAMDARFQGEKRMYGPDLHSAKSMTEESLEWKTPAWNTRIVTDFI